MEFTLLTKTIILITYILSVMTIALALYIVLYKTKKKLVESTELVDILKYKINPPTPKTQQMIYYPNSRSISSIDRKEGYIDVQLSDLFIRGQNNVFIRYYKDYKMMELNGIIPQLDLVVLNDIDMMNYKVYSLDEIYPRQDEGLVEGYVKEGVFYITCAVD